VARQAERNPMRLLTLARDLRRRRARERQSLFVAEGVRAVEELLRAPISLRGALVAPSLEETPRGRALRADLESRDVQVLDVSAADFASAAETESPQGVLVVAEVPGRAWADQPLPDSARVLLLDGIQDPGNAGTILRTAAALGVHLTLALPGTVDLWNAKVVRSAMGALFAHPTASCTWDELDRFQSAQVLTLWGADAGGTPLPDVGVAPARLALAVGNEGNGLSDALRARASRLVALPIATESLNVAVAAGILLYELRA
jgi:RNA methyltransferase, TrmH family